MISYRRMGERVRVVESEMNELRRVSHIVGVLNLLTQYQQ